MTSDEFRIIANNLHLSCAEYGLQTWFNSPIKVRVTRFTYILWQSLLTWLTASDEIRVLAIVIQLIRSEYGFKHNLPQIKKFVCLRLAYSLSVLNMECKHDSQIEMSLSCNSSLIKTASVREFGQPNVFVYW